MTHKTSLNGESSTNKFVCKQNALLMTAIDSGTIEDVQKLLSESESLAFRVVNAPCGRMQVTPLLLAAAKGRKGGELVKLLLENGAKPNVSDKVGRTPLHNAALIGNAEAVEALLKAGAEVESGFKVNSWPKQCHFVTSFECNEFSADFKLPLPECWGRIPLHQAVKGGSPECVRLLLEAKSNVNVQDEKGTTPLLLAGVGITPGKKTLMNNYEEIVELLVNAGADVDVQNEHSGATALHHAAALCSLRAMRCLLQASKTPFATIKEGEPTVLHEAAQTGCLTLIELLLGRGASKMVNCKDRDGCTPLHKAAYTGARDCLTLLIKSGGDLSADTNEGVSVMDAIFAHIPRPINFLNDLFDGGINANNTSINNRNFMVTLDFNILCPHGSEKQMTVVTALMEGGSDLQQKHLVRHPLFETFLRFKWHRLRLFFYLLMVAQLGLVLSLSAFCTLRFHEKQSTNLNASASTSSGNGEEDRMDLDTLEITTHILITIAHRALFFFSVVLAVHLVIQIVMLPWHYVTQYETWINITCIILSLSIAVGHAVGGKMEEWILHTMAYAVLLVWTEFMLLIARIPKWGYYALMFYQVLRNVIKVLLTFSGLVIGFALSFNVQFHATDPFMDIWQSLVKTMVMMMGEYEYSSLFYGESEDNKMQPQLQGTSRIIFFIFIVLSSIVLMNLMVGLAVSDIQALLTEGHVQRLLKQAEFITHLEKLMVHQWLKSRIFPQWLHKMLDNRRSIPTKFEIQPSENSSGGKNMPYYLLEKIVAIAISNQRNMKTNYKFSPNNNYSDQDLYTSFSSGEYGSMSEELMPSSPVSSVDTTSVMTVLHQLQMELAEIKKALNNEQRDTSNRTHPEDLNMNQERGSKWTRPLTDIQEAQCILRRLRRANSSNNAHNTRDRYSKTSDTQV